MAISLKKIPLIVQWVIIGVISILLIWLTVRNLEKFTDGITGLNTLGGIAYINLDNRPDRLNLIKDELIKLGADENKMHRVAGVFVPKNGHKGCIQSHILALRIAKLNNWTTVGIFEDDAELNDNISPDEFEEKLKIGLVELPDNWDVLMLGTANTSKEPIPDKQIIRKLKSSTTSSAYIVNQTYYDKILNLFEHCNAMMQSDKWGDDDGHEPYALDQKWTELQEKDNWFCFDTDLIKQRRNSTSTINAKGEAIQI
jgi:hypothetical protein